MANEIVVASDSANASGAATAIPGNGPGIRGLIHTVRDQQVMLDSDLARLYGVEAKRVSEAVRKNIARFPGESCFHLTKERHQYSPHKIAVSIGTQPTAGCVPVLERNPLWAVFRRSAQAFKVSNTRL